MPRAVCGEAGLPEVGASWCGGPEGIGDVAGSRPARRPRSSAAILPQCRLPAILAGRRVGFHIRPPPRDPQSVPAGTSARIDPGANAQANSHRQATRIRNRRKARDADRRFGSRLQIDEGTVHRPVLPPPTLYRRESAAKCSRPSMAGTASGRDERTVSVETSHRQPVFTAHTDFTTRDENRRYIGNRGGET